MLSDDSYATVLLAVVIDRFGMHVFDWHPETIRLDVHSDFGVDLPKSSFDKIMAAITLITTNYFYQDARRFIELCNILAGDDFNPAVFDPADSAEMAWGVTEAMLLSPPEPGEDFSEEIKAYAGKVLEEEGFIKPPKVLKFASSWEIKYNFEDDPEMFQAIHEMQTDKADEIDRLTQDNLNEMLAQLESLPLSTGQTSNMVRRLKEGIQS